MEEKGEKKEKSQRREKKWSTARQKYFAAHTPQHTHSTSHSTQEEREENEEKGYWRNQE